MEQQTLLRQWLEVAHRHKKETGDVPIIFGQELYEYDDSLCTIYEVDGAIGDVFITVHLASRFRSFHSFYEVELTELKLRNLT